MPKKNIPLYDIGQISRERQKEIQISRFAPYLESHPNLQLVHKHSFYHLLFFTKGGGSHTIDFLRFPVTPYQIYFMIPGQVHSWQFEGLVDGYVINFSPEFFQSFLLRPDYLDQFPFLTGNPAESVMQIPRAMQSDTVKLFEELLRESQGNLPLSADMIRAILLQLFCRVGRLREPAAESKGNLHNITLLRNFRKNIDLHFTRLHLPKDYARMMFITPNHLNALCREMLGIPAGELIRNRIVLEAKRQLVNLDLSVSEIATGLNFDDNSYFTKFFRKLAGVTPEEFRRQALKQPGTVSRIKGKNR